MSTCLIYPFIHIVIHPFSCSVIHLWVLHLNCQSINQSVINLSMFSIYIVAQSYSHAFFISAVNQSGIYPSIYLSNSVLFILHIITQLNHQSPVHPLFHPSSQPGSHSTHTSISPVSQHMQSTNKPINHPQNPQVTPPIHSSAISLPLMMELGAMVSTMRVWARLRSPAFRRYHASSSTLRERISGA